MIAKSAQGLAYKLLNRLSVPAAAGCQINAAHSKPKSHAVDEPGNPEPKGPIKITQRIGLFDYTAEYKQGSSGAELKWCTTDKHEDPAESEDDSASAKSSLLAWMQRRYRYANYFHCL